MPTVYDYDDETGDFKVIDEPEQRTFVDSSFDFDPYSYIENK